MSPLIRRTILALFGACAVAAVTPTAAQTNAVHIIPQFAFDNRATFENMRVGYMTWGRLNEQRSNAILLLPGTSGARTWPTNYIGPGRAFDPERYFIISADPIGGGASSSPADGMGPDFPRYTLHDMVRAQHDLITRGLGIDRLLAVGGISLGAFQGLEWGVTFPEAARGLILWQAAGRSDRRLHIVMDAMLNAITSDAGYQGGRYSQNPTEGLRRAGQIYMPWVLSDAFFAGDPRRCPLRARAHHARRAECANLGCKLLSLAIPGRTRVQRVSPVWRRHGACIVTGAGESFSHLQQQRPHGLP